MGEDIGDLHVSAVTPLASAGGGLGGLLGGLLGGQSGGGTAAVLASLLDLDGDGNPLDDILQMAGKGMR